MTATRMFWILVAATGVLCAFALPTIRVFPLEVFANLRPQLAALALLLAIASAGVGRYGASAVLALACVVVVARAPELFERRGAPAARPELKVIWCNIFKDPGVAERLARLAAREQADVVVIGEPTRDFGRLQAAMNAFPYYFGATAADQHGVVVFSRTPLSDTRLSAPFLGRGYPVVSTSVSTGGGQITIVGLHPTVARSPARLRARDTQVLAAAEIAEASAPAVMLGDLNAAPWTTALREVARRSGMRRLGTGTASTWFAPFPVLGLPIDHALVSPGVQGSARVGPGVGSDHLPLIVTIARQPS